MFLHLITQSAFFYIRLWAVEWRHHDWKNSPSKSTQPLHYPQGASEDQKSKWTRMYFTEVNVLQLFRQNPASQAIKYLIPSAQCSIHKPIGPWNWQTPSSNCQIGFKSFCPITILFRAEGTLKHYHGEHVRRPVSMSIPSRYLQERGINK